MMYLSILWHMHQPYYVNLNTGHISTPTLIFRILFNYYPMLVLVENNPGVKVNFNLTPVLLKQIQGISSGKFTDRFLQLLEGKDNISAEEIMQFTDELPSQILRKNKLINFLKEKVEKNSHTAQDLFDLKIHLHLICFHPLLADEEIERMIKKGRHFDESDREILYRKEKKVLADIINAYKNLQDKGQIEISTSPMMHPIMPLLYATDIARKTKTSLSIPEGIFSYPEDAKEQLTAGMQLYEDLFGKRPAGIWPPEGSLSNEILELLAEQGILWTATDEYLLTETLSRTLSSNQRYSIWDFRDRISIFFRDHLISDLIGFGYQQMEETNAAMKLVNHLHNISTQNKDCLVTIILDGENPWDFYPEHGKTFLSTLYKTLSESSEVKTITVTESLNANIRREKLDNISPGTWMGANFDNWIGKDPANKAWGILSRARKKVAEKITRIKENQQKDLMETIMIAESSDWFWWYSLSAERKIKARFDAYFRNSIRKIYELLEEEIPEFLNLPVEEYLYEEVFPYIKPCIDGKITHFYEWHDAVKIEPSNMWLTFKPVDITVKRIFYGYDEDNLFFRIDFKDKPDFTISLSFHNSIKKTFTIISDKQENGPLTVVTYDIMEIKVPRREILREGEKTISFSIKIMGKNGQEIVLPACESFKIHFAGKEENWIV